MPVRVLGFICAQNTLSLVDNGDGSWNVDYTSNEDIIFISFTADNAIIEDAYGGDAEIFFSDIFILGNNIYGFDDGSDGSNNLIPSGNGTLIVLVLSEKIHSFQNK